MGSWRWCLGLRAGVWLASFGSPVKTPRLCSSTSRETGDCLVMEMEAGSTMSTELRALLGLVFWLPVVVLSFLIMRRRRPVNRLDYWGVLLLFLASFSV